jgi:hypothetical protein
MKPRTFDSVMGELRLSNANTTEKKDNDNMRINHKTAIYNSKLKIDNNLINTKKDLNDIHSKFKNIINII